MPTINKVKQEIVHDAPTLLAQNDTWLTLETVKIRSRLLIGIEQYTSSALVGSVLRAANADVLLIAPGTGDMNFNLDFGTLAEAVEVDRFVWVGVTSYAQSAAEAVKMALILQDMLGVKTIKLDVRRSDPLIFPDNGAVLDATKELLARNFAVLPFIFPDPIMAMRLEQLGCVAIRLMAAPIGSGRGILNLHAIRTVMKHIKIPVIVEGGLGLASDVATAMELGADAVLVNSAIANSKDPVKMAESMRKATEAGRITYLVRNAEYER